MSIREYQQIIEAHEFLHDSNQYIIRQKYNTRPDPSCQICNPIIRCNLPAIFLRFWDWYRNKYGATSITSYTVEYFEKASNSIDYKLHSIYVKLIPTSVRYYLNTPNKEFKEINAELEAKFRSTIDFTVNMPLVQSVQDSDSDSYKNSNLEQDSNSEYFASLTSSQRYQQHSNQIEQSINRITNILQQTSEMAEASGSGSQQVDDHVETTTVLDIDETSSDRPARMRQIPINRELVDEPEHSDNEEETEPTTQDLIRLFLNGLNETLARVPTMREATPKESKIVDIPIFKGGDDDPVIWFEAFERACVANNISNARKLHIVPNFLKATALTWYNQNKNSFTYWNNHERQARSFKHLFEE